MSGNRETRLSSPILLRPWLMEGGLRLLLVGPRHLVQELAEPSGNTTAQTDAAPAPQTGDPVAELLAPPLSFERFKVFKTTLEQWQKQGRTDLIEKLIDATADQKYAGLRSQAWFPKTMP